MWNFDLFLVCPLGPNVVTSDLGHRDTHVISLNGYFVLHDSIKNLRKIDLAIFFQHLLKRQLYMTPISISLDQETT